MAKHNPCDILTGDFNPLVGCERYSAGCRDCWFLSFIFPWQQRLGHIPPGETPDRPTFFPHRMTVEALKVKNGIVGICQHGDLFWERVDIDSIHHVLDLIDQVAQTKRVTPKYVLWTKRAERMAQLLAERYPAGVPSYFACAVSIENQHLAETRLPHLLGIEATRIAVLEPLLGPLTSDPTSTVCTGLWWVRKPAKAGRALFNWIG